jgi:hypothetical protein
MIAILESPMVEKLNDGVVPGDTMFVQKFHEKPLSG